MRRKTLKPLKIVIFGQYKSGTTGLLYKIKNSLPDNTRVLNEYKSYRPGLFDRNRFILAKVIAGNVRGREVAQYDSFLQFDKKIYIIRDPRDWLVSGTMFLVQEHGEIYKYDERLDAVVDLFRQKENEPDSVPILRIIEKIISYIPGQSVDVVRDWIVEQYQWLLDFETRIGEHYRIKYEDFVDGDLSGLEEYLGMDLPGKADVGDKNHHVVRSKGYGEWKSWFTDEDVEFFRPLFRSYMIKYGYDDEWERPSEKIINPELCTHYILRTVELKKKKSGWKGSMREALGKILSV